MWQCAHIWTYDLQLWDEKTSNLLVYHLQLPYKYDGHHGQDGHHGPDVHYGRDGHPGTGQDGKGRVT